MIHQLTILQEWKRALNSGHRPLLKDTLRLYPPPMLRSFVFLHSVPPLDYHWSGYMFLDLIGHAWTFRIALHWLHFFLRLMLRAQDAEFCFEP